MAIFCYCGVYFEQRKVGWDDGAKELKTKKLEKKKKEVEKSIEDFTKSK